MSVTTSARHSPATSDESADELGVKTIPGARPPRSVSLRRTVGAKGDGWWSANGRRVVHIGGWVLTLLALVGGLGLLWNLLFTGPTNSDVWLDPPELPPPSAAPVEPTGGSGVDSSPNVSDVEPSDDGSSGSSGGSSDGSNDSATPGESEGSGHEDSGGDDSGDDSSGRGSGGGDDSDSSGHGSDHEGSTDDRSGSGSGSGDDRGGDDRGGDGHGGDRGEGGAGIDGQGAI
jgi:hypothetical protein